MHTFFPCNSEGPVGKYFQSGVFQKLGDQDIERPPFPLVDHFTL